MGRKLDILLKGFIAAKCLTLLNLTTSRIKVSRNRKSIAVRQMRGEIAQLLRSGQATHVYDTKINSLMREENTVAVYDLIDHFCLSIISQFPVIETQRYCPPDLKEPIASLIYAAPRCVELPELNQVKDMLTTKYGKEFTAAAVEIRPECGVSRQIIELLSTHPATEQMKVKLIKEICLQNNIKWRSEWGDFLDASSQMVGARVDIRRAARDEGHVSSQQAETASSSIRSSNVDQDIKAHPHRGSRQGESNSFGLDEAIKHHVSSSAFGPTHGSIPREETKANNSRVLEDIDEPYEHASVHTSPGFGPRRGAHPKEDVTRANRRVPEGMDEPYSTAFGPKHGSFPKDEKTRDRGIGEPYKSGFGPKHSAHPKEEVTRANSRLSEGMDEPYNTWLDRKRSSLHKEEVTRANMKVSEGIDEPYNPAFGKRLSSLPKEEATTASMRVSEGMDELYNPVFGTKHGALRKEEVTKANTRVSESLDEPYNPGLDPKCSSLHKEEVTRANMRVSECDDQPYNPVFGKRLSALPKEEVTRASMRVSGGMDEPYNPAFRALPEEEVTRTNTKVSEGLDEPYSPAFGQNRSSLPKEEVTRANTEVLEGRIEPTRPNTASFGSYKVADYKQEVHEDRAEYRMQHHDEISDSGSEVFVYVEDDEVALSHKEEALRSNVTNSSFRGDAEHHSSNSSLRATSLGASLSSKEGSHRRNSLRASDSSAPLKEDDKFASTAKAIAAEAARLAVLDYARRCSRSGSLSMDLGDLIDDGLDNMIEKTVYSKTKVDEDDHDDRCNMEFRRDSNFNRPSKTAADHKNDDIHRMEYTFSGKSGNDEAVNHERLSKYEYSYPSEKEKDEVDSIFERPTRGEKLQFNYQSQHNSVNVRTSLHDASAPIYGHGPNKNNVQSKNAESLRSDEASYKQEPYNASGSMPEKSPVLDDSSKESPHRNKYSQESSDQVRQHRSLSRFKEPNYSYVEDEPYREKKPSHPNQMTPQLRKNPYQEENLCSRTQLEQTNANSTTSRRGFFSETKAQSPTKLAQQQHATSKGSDEDKQYIKGRDASMAGYGNRSISTKPRQRQATESDNFGHEETTAEKPTMRRRQGSSPCKWSVQQQEAIEKDSLLNEKTSVEKVQRVDTPSAANLRSDGYNMSRQSRRSLEVENPNTKEGQGHTMSKLSPRMTHPHPEKSTVDEILSAKWQVDDVSATAENMEFRGAGDRDAAQNKLHERATRSKPLAQDSSMDKRTPSQQEERELDPVPVYTRHGLVDDLRKKVPSGLMSVRQQHQNRREEDQPSDHKPYNRTIREEQKTPSKHHEGDWQHRQGEHQGEQDLWPEKARPQYYGGHQKHAPFTHQKPTSFTSAERRKMEDVDAAGMSPLRVHEPPTRKPPPLPQSNTPIQAGWAKEHPLSEDQRKQGHMNTATLPEDAGPYERNNSAKNQRRSQPPSRPPPSVASVARATERENPVKLDKESRHPPPTHTRPTLASSKSDPVILASKTPSSSSSSTSISADPPAPAAPKAAPKLPHVDDIAANLARLAALKQARSKPSKAGY